MAMKMKVMAALLTAGSVAAAGAAWAATATDDMGVSATVVDECTIEVSGDLSFGTLATTGGETTSENASGVTVTVNCTLGTDFDVTDDGGVNEAVDGTGPRRLQIELTGTYLNYTLSKSATYDSGSEIAVGSSWGSAASFSTAEVINVSGNIAAGQPVAIGSYVDTVTFTVTYAVPD